MTRPRINPHDRGTPEHGIHNWWRKANADAAAYQRQATELQARADAERAKADRYAEALTALGHPPTEPLRLTGPK